MGFPIYKGPRSPFDSDSDPHVDSVGTLGHMNNVNLHLNYQYMHHWSSWEETQKGPYIYQSIQVQCK